MKYYIFLIKINTIIYFLYKCVQCQENVVPQAVQAQNFQNPQFPPPQEPQMSTVNNVQEQVYLNNENITGPVDLSNTLEGNVLKENPVEKLKELSKDISVEISQNPYYKIPGLTRKIREIAILHPDLMEKLGVYVIPIPEEKEENEEKGEEKTELQSEETKEGEEESMRSEIDELMDKTEMMKAMSPEEKLEYIPQLKEKIVYQILKNREILEDLTQQMRVNHMGDFEYAQEAQGQEYYGNEQYYPNQEYYQGYENYPNNQGYEGYPNYPEYQNYQNYPGYENYQNYGGYPGYGY